MLSWITGSRINDIGDLDTPGIEASLIEPPETPAPIFAVNAFKHALFGTPAPQETIRKPIVLNRTTSKARFQALDDRGQGSRSRDNSSPAKPTSILMTPGTVNGRRKNVTFGSGVVDNEGRKQPQQGKVEVPSDCPGKFPSPYTPKEKKLLEIKSRTNLTEPLNDNHQNTKTAAASQPVQRAKDDADITLDVLEPRSQSGRYWKEAHEAYAAKSEREMRKLIAKQKLAKDFAKKKDAEAAELRLKLDSERKKYRVREKSWETSMKDVQERLRKAVADNTKYAAELALMRQQLQNGSDAEGKRNDKGAESENSALLTATSNLPDLKIDESQWHMSSSPMPKKIPSLIKQPADIRGATEGSQVDGVPRSPASNKSPRTSSDPIPTPTPVVASKSRDRPSPRTYNVSKRAITVTTARVKAASPSSAPSEGSSRPAVMHTKELSNQQAAAEDSDLDLWAISNLESSGLENINSANRISTKQSNRPALQSRTANNAKTSTDLGSKIMPENDSENMVLPQTEATKISSPRSAIPVSSNMSRQNSLRHFPGSPAGAKKPLESSLANAKTNLPESRQEQARQRLAARRAQRKTKDELHEKENVGAVLASLLSG